jgi:hypothetical protein
MQRQIEKISKTRMHLKIKKGALHRMLGISMKQKIPPELLSDIIKLSCGNTMINKYGIGRREIYITHLLKERAQLAKNMIGWSPR